MVRCYYFNNIQCVDAAPSSSPQSKNITYMYKLNYLKPSVFKFIKLTS